MKGHRDHRLTLSGGLTLQFRAWGGAGPHLLLLHGFMGSLASWGDLPEGLHGLQVVAVDLPGHGRSDGDADPLSYRIPEVARLLGEFQERLFGGSAFWLGYSMGGRIALAAAAEGVAMRGLLLEAASPGLATAEERTERRRVDDDRARRIEEDGMEAFLEHWLALPLFKGLSDLPREVQEEAARIRRGQDPARMAAWLRGGGTGRQPSYWGGLGGLTIPVHLLAGGRDARFVALARTMAERLPRSTVTTVEGAGHAVHLEAPERWQDWVRRSVTASLP